MKKLYKFFFLLLAFIPLIFAFNSTSPILSPIDDLVEGFKNPPIKARPIALWDWTNGNFSFSQISYELEQAKAKGMGGFDIWDVGILVDEKKITPAGPAFMSDESVQGIAHAVREAERLGLRLGLVTASSWNAGGSWVKAEHGVMGLFKSEKNVQGGKKIKEKLVFPEIPAKFNQRDNILEKNTAGLPTFYREVGVVAIPKDKKALGKVEVLDISNKMDAQGNLNWIAPRGDWTITRYVCAPTGQPLMVPSPHSNGRMIDHFSAEATEAHLIYIIEKLQKELGSLKNRALEYLYTDSYEANTAVWTPLLPIEFQKKYGYDMLPYLPVLDGKIVVNQEISQRFLFDYKKILSDLIIQNHYAKCLEICKKYGLEFSAEAGGPGPPVHNVPFEDLKALGALSFPRGEFWNGHKDVELLQIIKGIASASHLYNQKYVEAESFTSVWLWQEGPQQLKPLADRAFCEGLNRIVYHTFPHTPAEAGNPGWVYNFGTLIHVNNTWWEKSQSFHEYLARCSFILQQGNFVGDVAFYYGDKAPNFVKPKFEHPSLGQGFDYDVVNSESILKFMSVKNGKIMLPHNQFYEVLVLPDEETVNLEVLKKLEKMVEEGATVIGRKPSKTYGLSNYEAQEKEIQAITNRLWGACDSTNVQENRYGKGKIIWGKKIKDVLKEKGLSPDFQFVSSLDSAKLDYIHRRTDKDEIYFVRNVRNTAYEAKMTFRVEGKTPQLWDPRTGQLYDLTQIQKDGANTHISLQIEPYESFFIVFRTNPTKAPFSDKQSGIISHKTLEGEWEVRFPHGWRTPARTVFPTLMSWTVVADTNIRHFSGVAAYHKIFELQSTDFQANKQYFLDLGKVREIADVWLNGHHLGESCFYPHRFNVSPFLKTGKNYLVIEVANTLNNRMVGDAKLPEMYRRTKSNIIKGPNAWMHPWPQVPLLESGLLGPVQLLTKNP
jgi:hypothetical protein